MADLTDIQAAQAVKVIGAGSSGVETNPMDVESDGSAKVVSKTRDGTGTGITSTTQGAHHALDVALVSDSAGNNITLGQKTMANSVPVVVASDQSILPISGTVTANQGSPNTAANAWFEKITDGTDTAQVSTTGDLYVRDSINTAGQNRAQSVTTSAAEALGAATILANRKFISLTPTNGTIYWGFTNTVTTSTGTPIFKNQTVTIAATDSVHIYVIAGSTIDTRIAEGS